MARPRRPIAREAAQMPHVPGPWTIKDNRDLDGGIWIEVMHPEVAEVSIASVRNGCDEAAELGSQEDTAKLIAKAPDMLAVLDHVEAVMSIVQPRSSKKEYLETLAEVRAVLKR